MPAKEEYPDERHASHKTRVGDASSWDEICIDCGGLMPSDEPGTVPEERSNEDN